MSPAIFAGVVAAAIMMGGLCVIALIWWALAASQSRHLQRRLQPGGETPNDFGDSNTNPLLQGIAQQGKAIERALDTEGVSSDKLMIRAGWRSTSSRLIFYTLWFLSPLLFVGGFFLLIPLLPVKLKATLMLVLLGAMALIIGVLLPSIVRTRIAEARQKRMSAEVPLFIHVLVLLFESGLSTRQAFASMVREGRGVLDELGREIELVLRQVEAGAEISDVLTRTADALDVPDLTTVLALLRQVERYGGEVKEPLLDTLQVIEDRREMELREKVNLISGKMTVVMVLFFFPALLIFVAGPAYVSLMGALGGAVAK